MKAKQLKESYRTVHYWWRGLHTALFREVGRIRETEADNKTRWEIESQLLGIDAQIKDLYATKIGKAEIYEIRTGEK